MSRFLAGILLALAFLGCTPRELTRDDSSLVSQDRPRDAGVKLGTVLANDAGSAREIFVIDAKKTPTGDFEAQLVFWLGAPANRRVARPTFSTAVKPSLAVDAVNGVTWGYTSVELAALRRGELVEKEQNSGLIPQGTGLNAIKNLFVNLRDQAQTELDQTAPGSNFVGTFFMGDAWTLPP